ncbi:glycosyltransferase family 4 protein [Novosphingobium sp.]|uniref:glycosyltransferase family 4 protein n=1 Tax=Novosphingobium sp. TaxID=1874826 RepID=UPI002637479F|nr:glycosyltransferase family 4 protein [Novosphingobium sp.]
MRIAYVCSDPGVPVFGRKGCSVHVQEVTRSFLKREAGVTLFARRLDGAPPAGLEELRSVALQPVSGTSMAEREQALASADSALPRILDDHAPFDLVYERFSLWSHSAMGWAQARRIPGVLEVNAPLVDEQERHRALFDRARAETMVQQALGSARHIVAVSTGVADWVCDQGIARSKIQVIANGVDVARFVPVPQGASQRPIIGFVGTLKPWHGLDHLVRAAATLRTRGRDFRLLIVGDGPERAALDAQIESAGLASVTTLTGAVDPADVPGLIAQMDIAVAPYPDLADFYFSPLKVMEYMSAGRAVLASAIGDIIGLVDHDVTGRLYPAGNVGELAAQLDLLLADGELRARLGKAAREQAVAKMSWDSVAERILSFAGHLEAC